ncbi:hypothetical protein PGR10_05375 [Klebsiella sp. 141198]|uniref:hypothetical protein n=1 Tax=Klebsiella sp. 141198 TaxID=3020036 RepID=UPI003D346E33
MRYLLLFFLFLSDFAFSKPVNITLNDVRELSLKECLDINYLRLGKANSVELNDKSYLLVWFSIDNDSTKKSKELKKFIKDNTGHYFMMKPPVKTSESNMIFSLCMRFYESDKLINYIENYVFD